MAMKEIQRRRGEVQNQKRKPLGSVVPGKGASSGIKSNNKYMQEFANQKAANQKKRGSLLINMSIIFVLASNLSPCILHRYDSKTSSRSE
jgi:hypothetical protein